ncbi:PH domain-containing protein [Secundilactobacillus collinoides]|uniref:PH domain-containing protein n=1 Tax=Secundilactobacillus collinoides TaxID=33960 RepID=UPI000A8CE37B|nr:hypothetical protein [Secundilactobacillus collinoides]
MSHWEQLPLKMKTVWRLSAIGSAIAWLVILAILFVCHTIWHWPLWIMAVILGLGVIEVIVELVIIPYRYRFWRYHIADKAVEIERGFFFSQTDRHSNQPNSKCHARSWPVTAMAAIKGRQH